MIGVIKVDFFLEKIPILIEELLNKFLLIPLVVLIEVETDIIIFDVYYALDLVDFMKDVFEEFFIFDEFVFKLLYGTGLLVESKLTIAASIGIGISKMEL